MKMLFSHGTIIKLFQIEQGNPQNYKNLRKFVETNLPDAPSNFVIKFKDSDGNQIMIKSNKEIDSLFESNTQDYIRASIYDQNQQNSNSQQSYFQEKQQQFQINIKGKQQQKLQYQWQIYEGKMDQKLDHNYTSQIERLQFMWQVKLEKQIRKLNDEKFVQIQTLKKNFKSQINLLEDQMEAADIRKKVDQEFARLCQRQNQRLKQKERHLEYRIRDLEDRLKELQRKEEFEKKEQIKYNNLYEILLANGISDITVQILKSEEIKTLQEVKSLREEDMRNVGIKLEDIIRIKKIK